MSKRALLFPGQGSQYVSMAKDLAENSQQAKNILNKADEILEIPLSEYMFSGPVEKLKLTDITQPAIFLHSLTIMSFLKM